MNMPVGKIEQLITNDQNVSPQPRELIPRIHGKEIITEQAIPEYVLDMYQALFSRPPSKLSPREELDRIIQDAHQLRARVMIMRDQYSDHRGNVAEAEDKLKDVLTDLLGHLRDIDEGKE